MDFTPQTESSRHSASPPNLIPARRGISNSELALRLGVRENVVRRMLDPDHATRLGNIERALLAAGTHMFLALDAA